MFFPSTACPAGRLCARFFLFNERRLLGENNNTNMEGYDKMIDRLIKRLVKMFAPSPQALAKMASKQIQEAINGSSKADTIARFANIAASVTDVQKFVTDTLIDGKVSDDEATQV